VFIGHRKITSPDEMLSLVKKLFVLIIKQRRNSFFKNILKDIQSMLKRQSSYFLSGDLFLPSAKTQNFISNIFGLNSEMPKTFPFANTPYFADLLKICGNITFSTENISKETDSIWFESLQCLGLILISRLRTNQVSLSTDILMRLFPSIFKGPKNLVRGLFNIKTFREHNEMYDFCLEHESLLNQNSTHLTSNIRPIDVFNWTGQKLVEVDQSSRSFFNSKESKAQQEGLDRNIQQQVEKLRRLEKSDKLRVII
jgi:hypothetical protein